MGFRRLVLLLGCLGTLAGCTAGPMRQDSLIPHSAGVSPSPVLPAAGSSAKTAPSQPADGLRFEQAGQLVEAQLSYLGWVNKHPRDDGVWQRLGVVATKRGDHQLAETAFAQALLIEPTNAEVLADAGYAAMTRGQYPQAEQFLTQAVALQPNHRRAVVNLGLAIGMQGRRDEALALFQRVQTPTEARASLDYLARLTPPATSPLPTEVVAASHPLPPSPAPEIVPVASAGVEILDAIHPSPAPLPTAEKSASTVEQVRSIITSRDSEVRQWKGASFEAAPESTMSSDADHHPTPGPTSLSKPVSTVTLRSAPEQWLPATQRPAVVRVSYQDTGIEPATQDRVSALPVVQPGWPIRTSARPSKVVVASYQHDAGASPTGSAVVSASERGMQGSEKSQAEALSVVPGSHYAPAWNGMDAVALAREGTKLPGQWPYGAWYHERLYLFSSPENLREFGLRPAVFADPR